MPVLNKVVEELSPNTWTKGAMVKETEAGCKRCLLGWVGYAITGKDTKFITVENDSEVNNTKAARVVAETIQRIFPDRSREDQGSYSSIIVAFNDHKDTTFEDVRRVVEKAAWREPIVWE